MTFEVDSLRFNRAVERWMEALRKAPGEAIRTQFRLLMRDLLRFTPPTGGDVHSPKKQGENAVARDIKRAVLPLYEKDFTAGKIKALIRQGNLTGLQQALARTIPRFKAVQVVPFSPQLHRSQRASRGRVHEQRNVRTATLDTDQHAAYTRRIQGHVGMAKGGWAAAAKLYGTAVPMYASRHEKQGVVVDRSTQFGSPFIMATNKSPWARSGEDDRVVKNAMATREKAMAKHIEKLASESAAREGLR